MVRSYWEIVPPHHARTHLRTFDSFRIDRRLKSKIPASIISLPTDSPYAAETIHYGGLSQLGAQRGRYDIQRRLTLISSKSVIRLTIWKLIESERMKVRTPKRTNYYVRFRTGDCYVTVSMSIRHDCTKLHVAHRCQTL